MDNEFKSIDFDKLRKKLVSREFVTGLITAVRPVGTAQRMPGCQGGRRLLLGHSDGLLQGNLQGFLGTECAIGHQPHDE